MLNTSLLKNNSESQVAALFDFVTVFRVSVVSIGVIGCVVNIFVFLVLMDKKLRRQTFIIFTINQTVLDFMCCLLSLISYSFHLAFRDDPKWYSQSWSFAVCYVFTSDNFLLIFLGSSNVNLVLIAFERYMKIVHSTFYRNYFSRWMIPLGICLSVTMGIIINLPVFWTTEMENGQCIGLAIWSGPTDALVYALFVFLYEYALSVVMFLYCYGRIVYVISRGNKVFPLTTSNVQKLPVVYHIAKNIQLQVEPVEECSSGSTQQGTAATMACRTTDREGTSRTVDHTSQESRHRRQVNVIKTMLLISVSYTVMWFPISLWLVLFSIDTSVTYYDDFYYVSMILMLLNICMNPFIYASNHEAVRKQLTSHLCSK